MRTSLVTTAFAAAAFGLGACATDGPSTSYSAEMQALTAECQARGGIVTPVPGATSGRPRADNVCEIRGQGATRTSD